MLAMSTVLRREPPFKTIFGYALVFGEDGRPMHKSWGNAIEFDEAAERMGVDVMRWMFAKARPEENILFGWHAADEARRELLVLWNVYAFFVTYARLAGWTPVEAAPPRGRPAGPRPLDPVARRGRPRPPSRIGCATSTRVGATRALSDVHGRAVDLVPAPVAPPVLALGRPAPTRRRPSRRSTRRSSRRPGCWRRSCRSWPTTMYRNLVATVDAEAPDSVHLTRVADAPSWRRTATTRLEAAMAIAQRAVDLARTLRSAARLRTRQPLATAWLAAARPRPGGRTTSCSRLIADEINVKAVEVIADESDLVERRVKPLLPEDRQAARGGDPGRHGGGPRRATSTFEADGSVTLAGVTLAPDEVEIQATPRPGTAVAARRRPGRRHRHRADAGAASRGRRPRAASARSRTSAARPAWSSTTGSTCGSTAVADGGRRASARRRRRHARRPREPATRRRR